MAITLGICGKVEALLSLMRVGESIPVVAKENIFYI